MKPSDKKAFKLIAEGYGWVSKGAGLAGKIAGDRMFDALVAAAPSRDDVDRAAALFDAGRLPTDDVRRTRAEFLIHVESIAKTAPTVVTSKP